MDWKAKWVSCLIKFKESAIDLSLFILRQDGFLAYLFVYVDDIVVVGSVESEVEKLIK